ncbi:uncharacterized protein LOC123310914 [Coccinella septempunctata]|uniref:uncharacterized protein LOC123310914 n=1 Tax=Coccinella septempunctata TaxID=41139 RepID=UPI001D06F89B|nr:uncharacterized protein LOC123310914 [Coccinella septempunctata]
MTGTENTSEKNNGNEEVPPDDAHLPLDDKSPIYKTEITIDVNGSEDHATRGNEEEDIVILRNDKNTAINRSAYSKLHKNPNPRLSTLSLGRFELFSNFHRRSSKENRTNRTNSRFRAREDKHSEEEYVDYVPCVLRSESVDTVDKIEKELSNFIMDNTRKKDKKRTNSFRKLFSVSFFGKDKKKKVKEPDVNNSPSSDYVDNYQNETHSNSFIRNTPQRHTVGCDHYKREKGYESKPLPPKNIEEDPPPEVLMRYANNHINRFNKIRQSFENPDEDLGKLKNGVPPNQNEPSVQHANVIKYIDTSSSTTSTMESERFNTYQNALIAQAELQQLKRDNNGMERSKIVRNDSFRRDTPPRATDTYQPVNIVKPRARLPINSGRPLPNPYHNEKEEPDGKPNDTTVTLDIEDKARPEVMDIYGTVFDAIDQTRKCNSNRTSTLTSQDSRKTQSPIPRSPRSPSLEGSKLRLPSNRDTTPLQPRLKSPLPTSRISTEKIIATELLKNTNSSDKKPESTPSPSGAQPRPSSQEQSFNPQAESTPDNKTCQALNALREKFEENSQKLNEELDQIKQTLQNISHEESPERTPSRTGRINKDSYSNPTSSPRGTLLTSPRSSMTLSPLPPTKMLEVNCASPQPGMFPQPSPDVELRQKHPVVRRNGSQSNVNKSPSSPNKDEIRKSVEAYYWKEIKKIKEQEDYEIYLSQLHFSQRGYAEDPILTRRSRGLEENRSRRSSSVPRNPRQHQPFEHQQNVNVLKMAIPETNTVAYHMQDRNIYGYLPARNSQISSSRNSNIQRQTNGDYGTYKPIFRRGSLTGGGSAPQTMQTNKKVSFSNSQQPANVEAWPTKNGFTRSPPQRRLEKLGNNAPLEDDVFLPPQQAPLQQHQVIYGQNQVVRNHYNSDTDSIYGQNLYGYAGRSQMVRPANYNSDSEAVYGGRYYRTLSRQEMENLRNAQANSARQPDLRNRPVPRLTRHESIQLPEPPYGYATQYGGNRKYQPNNVVRDNRPPVGQSRISPRREILITDNIYGQHIGYRNDFVGSPYGYTVNNNPNIPEPLYASRPKQVTVRNKVCDMYGRIHDVGAMEGGIQASGVLMGQLQELPTSPTSFRRGTRLTASSNDMLYRRHNNYQLHDSHIEMQNEIPQMHSSRGSVRPLPPLPPSGKVMPNDKSTNSKKNNSSKKKKK